ncbi:MAG: hypothetical protein ACJ752_04580 [Gaiellaceae bacterium]
MRKVFAWLRRLTALGLIVVAAVLVTSGRWNVCRTELPSGPGPPTTVCNPPAATDLGPLLIAAIALMLLWQDIAEIGLPGGISVKRRLEQQEKKADQQEIRQGQLEERLSQVQQQIQQQTATAVAAPVTSVAVVVQSDRVLASTEQKEQTFLESQAAAAVAPPEAPPVKQGAGRDGADRQPDAPAVGTGAGELAIGGPLDAAVLSRSEPLLLAPAQPDPERASAEVELLRLWARLESLIQQVDSGATVTLPAAEGESLVRWRRVFAPELAYVKSVRNSVAHGIAVSETDIENTLEVARRLLSIPEAEAGLGRAEGVR